MISGCKGKEMFKNRLQDQNAENIFQEQIARFKTGFQDKNAEHKKYIQEQISQFKNRFQDQNTEEYFKNWLE